MSAQILVVLITIVTLFLFIQGNLRYDFVSLLTLIALVLTGLVPAEDAFVGFAHPAVITVAAVLIISDALTKTGAINRLVTLINRGSDKLQVKILTLMAITAGLSAFMNNVGALALIMPIALTIAKDNKISPSKLLMPVSFASLLGGMLTSIGTPPNLIISTYRVQAGKEAFPFFSFLPVGLTLALTGIAFTVLVGWKLIPLRESDNLGERFNLEDYLFELVVTDECNPSGIKLKDFHKIYGVGINVVSITRDEYQIVSPSGSDKIFPGDILIIKSVSKDLNDLMRKSCLDLKGAKTEKLISETALKSDNIALVDVVLRDDSPLIGRTAIQTQLRTRYNANLIAVSRQGISNVERLKELHFESGDILLLQVPEVSLNDVYSKMRALPLAERDVGLNIKDSTRDQIITVSAFAISILLATFNVLPVNISFVAVTVVLVISKVVTPREFYGSIEWPTIIMIGSLFALGQALETSGGTETIANVISKLAIHFSPAILLGILMTITIILSNLFTSNAAAILMAPIALGVANTLDLSVDPFLMTVSVGAASSFLTPIAHQSNTLVMGPGGYKFPDYWRLGLPLVLISIFVGVPMILWVWPL